MKAIRMLLANKALWSSLFAGIIAFVLCLLIRHLGKRFTERSHADRKTVTATRLCQRILIFLVLILAAVTILEINGINVTSLLTGLGVAGIIVGFALQDYLKDVIMGTNILLDHYFSIGDVIQCNGYEGEVIELSLKATKIRTLETGAVITVANRNITEVSRLNDCLEVTIPAPYQIPAEEIDGIAEEIASRIKQEPGIEDCRYAGTHEFAASSITCKLFVYGKPKNKYINQRLANAVIREVFAEHHISIPFNQLDVHLDTK